MKKTITSLSQLKQFAIFIADEMKSGKARKIGLVGPLGAGKTTFVKLLSHALNITDVVSSPTFTLMQEYGNEKQKLLHVDIYRINRRDEETIDQILETINSSMFVLVEWADKIPEIYNKMSRVYRFSLGEDENTRIIEKAK